MYPCVYMLFLIPIISSQFYTARFYWHLFLNYLTINIYRVSCKSRSITREVIGDPKTILAQITKLKEL